MAIEKGSFGVVLVGSDVIGEMTNYEFDEQCATQTTTVAGSDEVRNSPTIFSSNGSVACYLDDTDTGQQGLGAGSVVTLQMRPRGTGAGLPQRQAANAVIQSVNEPLDAGSGAYNRVTFRWVGGKIDRTAQT